MDSKMEAAHEQLAKMEAVHEQLAKMEAVQEQLVLASSTSFGAKTNFTPFELIKQLAARTGSPWQQQRCFQVVVAISRGGSWPGHSDHSACGAAGIRLQNDGPQNCRSFVNMKGLSSQIWVSNLSLDWNGTIFVQYEGHVHKQWWAPSIGWGNMLGHYWMARIAAHLGGFSFSHQPWSDVAHLMNAPNMGWLQHLPATAAGFTNRTIQMRRESAAVCKRNCYGAYPHACAFGWGLVLPLMRADMRKAMQLYAREVGIQLPSFDKQTDWIIYDRCEFNHDDFMMYGWSIYKRIPCSNATIFTFSRANGTHPKGSARTCALFTTHRERFLKEYCPNFKFASMTDVVIPPEQKPVNETSIAFQDRKIARSNETGRAGFCTRVPCDSRFLDFARLAFASNVVFGQRGSSWQLFSAYAAARHVVFADGIPWYRRELDRFNTTAHYLQWHEYQSASNRTSISKRDWMDLQVHEYVPGPGLDPKQFESYEYLTKFAKSADEEVRKQVELKVLAWLKAH